MREMMEIDTEIEVAMDDRKRAQEQEGMENRRRGDWKRDAVLRESVVLEGNLLHDRLYKLRPKEVDGVAQSKSSDRRTRKVCDVNFS